MEAALDELTRQFLVWVSEKPRSYSEAMEAWRTSCPRLPVWENAIADGLIQVSGGATAKRVTLTPRGSDALRKAK